MKPIRFWLVLAVVAAGGCDLYKDDCERVYPATGGALAPELLQRDPWSGQCQSYSYPNDGYYDSCGGPIYDAPTEPGYAEPNWPACTSYCSELAEDTCKDTAGCQAAYLSGGECNGDCPDTYYGCWATLELGNRALPCDTLDAQSCSGRDDCVRFHVHDDVIDFYESDPEVGRFLSCAAEESANSCTTIVDEQACLDADACIPVYQGNDCTCDGGDCTCQSYTFESCSNGDVCAFLDGKSFASVAELECGLTVDGPLPCHWSVSFADGRYDWHFSDVGQNGSFTCDGATITGSGGISGTYDFDTGTLTWDDVVYMQVP